MAPVFKWIATWELAVLLVQFLLGNSYLLLPATPAGCTDILLFPRLALLTGLFMLTTVAAAAILLLCVLMPGKGVFAGWNRASLFLLAIGLSAASTFLAVPTFEAGYGYRRGCVYSRDLLAVVVVVVLAVEHGCAALMVVAVAQD